MTVAELDRPLSEEDKARADCYALVSRLFYAPVDPELLQLLADTPRLELQDGDDHYIGPGGQEIGYWVRVGWTGRGYATAAARDLVAMAFAMPAVNHVEIHHDVANVASGRVPAKLGFRHVDDVRSPPEAPGETGVNRHWRLDREVWLARHPGAPTG